MGKSPHSASRYLTIMLGVAVGVFAARAVGAKVAGVTRDAARSPSERILISEFRESSEGKALAAHFATLPLRQVRDSSFALSQRGVVRLSDSDLVAYAALMMRAYQRLDPATCRAIALGNAGAKATASSLGTAMDSLDEASQRQFARLSLRAGLAELRGVDAPTVGGAAELTAAVKQIMSRLNDADQARFVGALERPAAYSDGDVCWATIQLFRGASEMSPEAGGPFMRGLLVAAAEAVAR